MEKKNITSNIRIYLFFYAFLIGAAIPEIVQAFDSTQTHPVFCGIELFVPKKCEFSLNNISKENEFISWTIDTDKPLPLRHKLPILFLDELEKMLIDKFWSFKKYFCKVSSFNEELDGLVFYVKKDDDIRYYIFAYGLVKSEQVRIYACTLNNPMKKKKLPKFIQQLIQIKR